MTSDNGSTADPAYSGYRREMVSISNVSRDELTGLEIRHLKK